MFCANFDHFDTRRLEKLYPQHQWQVGIKLSGPGVQDPVHRPEQIVVGAEVRRAPRNPSIGLLVSHSSPPVDVAVGFGLATITALRGSRRCGAG